MVTNMETVASTDLSALTGPPGPVLRPANCPGYGRELPGHWRCPSCPIADECYAHYVSNSRAANDRGSFSNPPRKLD